ncbi:hypothetical protein AWH56_010780 [Anaerobacillus isosaccharinicus]|uniref:Uncharacterized protein n=1 Tax=Anaerobacillus isosaccharinicus TaxID=1532552 RepID=A0A1S2MDE3_9BACI|nr:hypothetical protein [Anaerobacillus isosaccharinicus]MBA5588586.1 hypothetical protein [Anaerobacillus isosaccharinicus]QOY38000.1 hypothetical protein AWH56_010780 [Anaerobacillus isosaccharinicus]
MNINPMFNSQPKSAVKEKSETSKPRKQRSDKKHDIKIVVSKVDKRRVLYNSRLRGLSEKKYCTELVRKAFEYNYEFYEVDYPESNLTVHINPDAELYTEIVNKSVDWQCSIRRAAFKIFREAIRLESEEIKIEGLQQKKSTTKIYGYENNLVKYY